MSLTFRKIDGFNDSDKFVAIGNEIYINDLGKSYKSKLVNGLSLDYVLSLEFDSLNIQHELSCEELQEEILEKETQDKENNGENVSNSYEDFEDNIISKTIYSMEYPLISNSRLKSKTNYMKNKQSNSKGQKKVKSENLQEKNKKDKKNKATLLKDGNSYKTNVRKDNEVENIFIANYGCYDLDEDCSDDCSYDYDDDISNIEYYYSQMDNWAFDNWSDLTGLTNRSNYLTIYDVQEDDGIMTVRFGERSSE